MQTIHNLVQWSFVISGVTGTMALSVVFSSWFLIKVLVVLTGLTA